MRALLACARCVLDERNIPEFGRAIALCTSPARLSEMAIGHKMLGQLHRLVTGLQAGGWEIDPELVRRLDDLQRHSTRRNLRLAGRLLRILHQLRLAGVEAIPYKGPALSERLYGDPTLRSSADLDLIIGRYQVPLARGVLLAAGFQDAHPFNADLIRLEGGRWGAVEMVSHDFAAHIDLHWRLAMGLRAKAMEGESVLERAQPGKLLGREILALSDGDLLLASCMHGTKDRWCSIEALLGLALQTRATKDDAWGPILVAARHEECERRVIVAVAHASRVFGLSTPGVVADAMRADTISRILMRSLKPDSLELDGIGGYRLVAKRLLWVIASEDSTWKGLWYGMVRLIRPGPLDWQERAFPPRARWLYYLTRPFRLAGAMLKRS